jgi:hypothetical protein
MSTEFLEVGDKGALICGDSPLVETLRTTLEGMEFKCHVAATPDQAIERMTYTTYDAILVAEDIDGSTLESNTVLQHLTSTSMQQRRNSYTVLIGESMRTLDAMQAYGHSMHLVVNPADLGSVGPILKKGLMDFDRLYSTYVGVLRDTHQGQFDRRESR